MGRSCWRRDLLYEINISCARDSGLRERTRGPGPVSGPANYNPKWRAGDSYGESGGYPKDDDDGSSGVSERISS